MEQGCKNQDQVIFSNSHRTYSIIMRVERPYFVTHRNNDISKRSVDDWPYRRPIIWGATRRINKDEVYKIKASHMHPCRLIYAFSKLEAESAARYCSSDINIEGAVIVWIGQNLDVGKRWWKRR